MAIENIEKGADRLLTIEELAAILNVPKSFIYQRTRRGANPKDRIPFFKVGHHLRFNPKSVGRWLKKNEIK